MITYIYILALVFLYNIFQGIYNPKHPLHLNVYFGVPGSGKTTFAAYLTKKARYESIIIRICKRFPNRFTNWIVNGKHWKRSLDVYSNVPITGTYKVDCRKDIGVYMMENGKLIIDEAGVDFNSRKYKDLPQNAIKWFKYHRHYGMSVDVFSQSHEDMDITLRRLAQNFFVVKKSLIPFFICIRRIRRKVGIDENTHQIVDAYYFGLPIFDTKRVFCPPLWKLFNTYDHEELPQKKWEVWGATTDTPTPPTPDPAPDTDPAHAPEVAA